MANKKKMPPLVTPSHGRGKLLAGGVPGNKGGSGAPPSELRARLRGSVEERVRIIEEILDDPETSTSDRIRCVDVLLKYGLGTAHEVGGVDGGPILLAAHAEKATQEMREKLKRLAAHARKLPASERPDPAKAIPDPPRPPKKYDPDEVIAVFEDRGKGIRTQEPTEKAEATVVEPEPEPEAMVVGDAERSTWPPPGRAFVSSESLRSRLF